MPKNQQHITRPESAQTIPDHATKVHKGVLFDVWQWEQRLPNGSTTIFERISRRDSVATFPVLTDGRIALTRQQQPGKKPFVAAPGGRINPNEGVLAAAQRELLEEAGMKAARFILWKAVQPSSEIDWASYIFIAKAVEKTSDPHFDPGEKSHLIYVDFNDFLDIATRDDFYEKEIQLDVFKAKLNEDNMLKLRDLFNPTT